MVGRDAGRQGQWDGAARWAGGDWGGFAHQEGQTELLQLLQSRNKVMVVPQAAFLPLGCGEGGGMAGMCCAPAAPDRLWGMESSAPTGFGVFAERDGGTSGLAWKRHKRNGVLNSVSVSGT